MSTFSFFKNKKAVSLTVTKIVGFIILILVVIIVGSQFSGLTDTSKSGISDFKLRSHIEKCEISSANCRVVVCDEEIGEECNDVEIATWNSFVDYHKKCSKEIELSNQDYEKLDCGVLADKIGVALSGGEGIRGGIDLDVYEKDSSQVFRTISSNSESIEEFANEFNIDKNKLIAFIEVESASNAFDGDHPTVRFECLRFNKEVSSSQRVPCDTDKYRFGNYEHTNKAAFFKALEIDREEALLQTSYGLGQIMGFNYKIVGYNNVEDFYEAMFDEKKQLTAFLNFVLNKKVILSELQSSNTDWAKVAYTYNGRDYAKNNYDKKLEDAYSRLS